MALSLKNVNVVHVTVPISVPKTKLDLFKKKSEALLCNIKLVSLGYKLTSPYFFHWEITAPRTYLPILLKDNEKMH